MTLNSTPSADIRHDWTRQEIETLFRLPLLDLVYRAQNMHRRHQDDSIQLASLLSVKTGGCPEDCGYCPQSAHYTKGTGVAKQRLMDVQDVLVKGVRAMGMEACVTLGMMKPHQAKRLAEAGLTAYNHNLDTGPEYYNKIISTRTYEDRLNTLEAAREAGITLCCGGIIGMGEGVEDRASMLQVLSNMTPHPESVPVNALVAVKGTPMADRPPVDSFDLIRMVAVARIIMPKARVRLSAGRQNLTKEAQVLCFMAGANSIFYGEKLLTTANNDAEEDRALIASLGLTISAGEHCHADIKEPAA
jgi:biotin synthase